MKIVADENIPYAQALFSTLGDVRLVPGRSLQRADVIDADILLVRSVTRVNEALLHGTPVKFVGTCTIGTDHLDKRYLDAQNITYTSAPGCNANSVVQYALAALAHLDKIDKNLRYAVVGCGNVGGRLYRAFHHLGLDCVGIDPYLTTDDIPQLGEFSAIYACDVICVHTPLLRKGLHPTYHLFNQSVLDKLKPGAVLLNAGRGDVIDNEALHNKLKTSSDLQVVLDVWENEPTIHTDLLKQVTIGTPHIAGYSFEGRVNGSTMIFQALSQFLEKDVTWQNTILTPLLEQVLGERVSIKHTDMMSTLLATHPIYGDHQRLMAVADNVSNEFDRLRKTYPQRREFTHYVLSSSLENTPQDERGCLEKLGFVFSDASL